MSVQLEICVETVASAIAAHKGGAHRVELCSGLVEGGVTPSIGLVTAVVQAIPIPVHVLIRPRAGDFVFSEDEMKAMECDIKECAKAGAAGVVVGALTPSGDIDKPKLHRFLECAARHSLPVTFHRAFDHTRDPMGALQVLISSGVTRLLTSGQRATAEEGVGLIGRLVEEARGRIQIMAGGCKGLIVRSTSRGGLVEREGREADTEAGGGSMGKESNYGRRWGDSRECSKHCRQIRCISRPCIGTIAGTANGENPLQSSLPIPRNKYAF
ncbi:unnamed protein product [Closterium sp. Yama58-4]|nr:unnamed protein product [Closterium sp. Yama58-4]